MTTSGYLENGGRRFIRNTGTHLPTYVEWHPRGLYLSVVYA
jgi:hypothetical protein